jgi:alpha/beta superfamily hydrolase
VIGLHCNGGCRLEQIPKINPLLNLGFNFVSFDFSGSGLSDGEFVSLGFYESMDVEVVVRYVRC